MTAPLASVVITSYNTGRYLPETLKSVFAQSYENFEVIVVDDGSIDDTREQARAFASRLTLLERAHEGLGPARNAGLARATGDFVAFLDSDDLWIPDTLRTQVDVARRHPESGLVVCDGVEFDDDQVLRARLLDSQITNRLNHASEGTLTDFMYASFCAVNRIACPAQALITRRAIDFVGDVCAAPNGVDYDYYLRVTRVYPVTFHGASLARYRYRSDSMSGADATRSFRWSVGALAALERQQALAIPEDRDMLRRAITGCARRALSGALDLRLSGSIPEPDEVARIYRLLPNDPVIVGVRTASALPAPLDRLALRGARATRRAVRKLGSVVHR
jgi:glycosyltransferase involved in cell wall biosynthesis